MPSDLSGCQRIAPWNDLLGLPAEPIHDRKLRPRRQAVGPPDGLGARGRLRPACTGANRRG